MFDQARNKLNVGHSPEQKLTETFRLMVNIFNRHEQSLCNEEKSLFDNTSKLDIHTKSSHNSERVEGCRSLSNIGKEMSPLLK